MSNRITVERLSLHIGTLPILAEWFRSEWPAWYGPGGTGNVDEDLHAFSTLDGLPIGVIALLNGAPCGVAALKEHSIPSHAHLTPWAAAGFVIPSLRGPGIGARLLSALESEAKALGFPNIYCGTATAASLLLRAQWNHIESVLHDGKQLNIYGKTL